MRMFRIDLMVAVVAGLVFAACSGSDKVKATPDALATADAPTASDAAVEGPVTVRAVFRNTVVPGAKVIFRNPDGSERAIRATDAKGEATEPLLAGSSVTIVMESAVTQSNDLLVSYVGVKPGDVLQNAALAAPPLTTFALRLPALPAGASVVVLSTCGNGAQTAAAAEVPVMLDAGCASGNFAVLVRDANNGNLGSIYKADVVVGANRVIDLSNAALVPPGNRTLAIVNVPAGLTRLTATLNQTDGKLALPPGASLTFEPVGTTNSGQAMISNVAGVSLVASLAATNSTTRLNYFVLQPDTAAPSIDLGAIAMPSVLTRPVFDGSTRSVRWVQSEGGQAHGVFALLSAVNLSTERRVSHQILAPYAEGEVRLPTMPPGFASLDIGTNHDVSVGNIALLALAPRGYDGIRPNLAQLENALQLLGGQAGMYGFSLYTAQR